MTPGDINNANAVLQVSVTANSDLYSMISAVGVGNHRDKEYRGEWDIRARNRRGVHKMLFIIGKNRIDFLRLA